MKTLIIPIILLFAALWGLGEFHLSFFPFKVKLEKPYQLIGITLIVIGLILFQTQERIDTKKRILQQLTEAAEAEISKSINPI